MQNASNEQATRARSMPLHPAPTGRPMSPSVSAAGELRTAWHDAAPWSAGTPKGAVAYLVSRYPAVSHTFILREVQGLRALGLRVEVASVNAPDRPPERMTDDERAEAVHTYGLKQHGVAGALAALGWAAATRPLALLLTLREALGYGRGLKRIYALAYAVEAAMVARWMSRRGLQHLHVHFGNEAAAVGTLARTLGALGLSITIHGPDEFDDVPGQRLRQKVEAADRVVCISQFARSQLMRLTAPAHWAKLQLCRLGVDSALFAPAAPVRAPGPVRLLSVGRLAPAKGQLLLVQACAALHREGLPFELVIVGDGPDRARLEDAVRRQRLGSCVRFTGALNQAEVRAELARADAFVLPSLAEGIPVVLMEAMASGVPCVTSPVNGIPELIQHDHSGLLATPGDAQALAVQLQRVITDATLRRRLATAGRTQVERVFHHGRNVAHLASIFQALPTVRAQECAA
jgi:glycosyltransferase involved in cell wall biosynthesis